MISKTAVRDAFTAQVRRSIVLGAMVAVALLTPWRAVGTCFNDSDCDDGHFCTTDHCVLFVCVHFARDCDDFNGCTNDRCDDQLAQCVHDNRHLTRCDDFNIFTTDEVCCAGSCVGIPDNTVLLSDRCCVTTDCPAGQTCVDTVCLGAPAPTATATRTGTPTRTSTRTPLPDLRPVLSLDSVTTVEGNTGTHSIVLTASLSRLVSVPVTFNFATVDGSAIAGSDYVSRAGAVTIPAGTLSIALPGITILSDLAAEPDESFSVLMSNVPSTIRIGTAGIAVIKNDDTLPPTIPGIGALAPHDGVTAVDQPTPLTLTWTNPIRWRDLTTLDLRLRSASGIALWLRFDEAANTIAQIRPNDVSLGAAFPPGSADELRGNGVTEILQDRTAQASGPEAPTVDVTFVLRFDDSTAGATYLVDAAAIDDAGDVEPFDTIGTISVASLVVCPGDCGRDGVVDVDELVLAVGIALGTTDISTCSAIDSDATGTVGINELVAAVDRALVGCDAPADAGEDR